MQDTVLRLIKCKIEYGVSISQLGLLLRQNINILVRYSKEIPHVRPSVASKERLRLSGFVRDPEPWSAERPQFFVQPLRHIRQGLLVLGIRCCLKDVHYLRLGEVLVECLRHIDRFRDIDVLNEAEVPKGHVSELVSFSFERVFDIDHTTLGLWW